jgi:hypothetical protein
MFEVVLDRFVTAQIWFKMGRAGAVNAQVLATKSC